MGNSLLAVRDINHKYIVVADVKVFSQGMAAVIGKDLKGFNMVADIGNGTMNIMQVNDERPIEKSLVTEKYGVNLCVKDICRELAKASGSDYPEEIVEPLIRYGIEHKTDIVAATVEKMATKYTKEIWNKILDNGYKEGITRLYVVGGGGCLLKHFGDYANKSGIVFIDDICANGKSFGGKGYVRINLATQREIIAEALDKMEAALLM